MPNHNAHTYFGQRVLELLPLELRRDCVRDLSAFRLGLYGPDPLIFSFQTKYISDHYHRHWREESLPELERSIRRGSEVSRSFAAGYLLHQLLDEAVHPQIYRYMEQGASHLGLELQLDHLILREMGQSEYPSVMVRGRERTAEIAAAFLHPATEEQYLSGLWRMAAVNGAFGDRMDRRTARKSTDTQRRQAKELRRLLEEAVRPAAESLEGIAAPLRV